MRIYYTDAEHAHGVIEGDGGEIICAGPIPPNDVGALTRYEAFIAAGGVVELYVAPPAPPARVTQYQAREALRRTGNLAAVNALVNGLGEEHEAYVAWHYREVIQRDSPLIAQLAGALDFTPEVLDDLFALAATL